MVHHRKYPFFTFDLDHGSHEMLASTLYIMRPMHQQEIATSNVEDAIARKNIDLEVKVTQNVALYSPHHVTYTLAKFEVATFNGSGGYVFTRNSIILP